MFVLLLLGWWRESGIYGCVCLHVDMDMDTVVGGWSNWNMYFQGKSGAWIGTLRAGNKSRGCLHISGVIGLPIAGLPAIAEAA